MQRSLLHPKSSAGDDLLCSAERKEISQLEHALLAKFWSITHALVPSSATSRLDLFDSCSEVIRNVDSTNVHTLFPEAKWFT